MNKENETKFIMNYLICIMVVVASCLLLCYEIREFEMQKQTFFNDIKLDKIEQQILNKELI